MILYFSATGNSEYAAKQIAKSLNDRAISAETASTEIVLKGDEVLGIVTPSYFGQLPSVMREYLERLRVFGYKNQYAFSLATYGSTPGAVSADIQQVLKKKGIILSAHFGVQMPDTWTPIYDVSNAEKTAAQLDNAKEEIGEVRSLIRRRKSGNFIKGAMPALVLGAARLSYDSGRKTKHLHVNEDCIGCGTCAAHCPASAIRMQGGHPLWVKDLCAMCLRCLHNCPSFAIQYDNKTKKHGQYRFPVLDKRE